MHIRFGVVHQPRVRSTSTPADAASGNTSSFSTLTRAKRTRGSAKQARAMRSASVSTNRMWPFVHAEIHVHPDALRLRVLVFVDADAGGEHHVSQEDMPHPRTGDLSRPHSATSPGWGDPHCRCCPPSNASICPVKDGSDKMANAADATSSGLVPRPSGTEAAWRAN